MRYKTNEGQAGRILKVADRLWMQPDDPAAPLAQLHGRDGKPLSTEPVRYTAPLTPEVCERFLTEADAFEREGIEILCERMGLKRRQRTRVVRLLALMVHRGLVGDAPWEMICHHARKA